MMTQAGNALNPVVVGVPLMLIILQCKLWGGTEATDVSNEHVSLLANAACRRVAMRYR